MLQKLRNAVSGAVLAVSVAVSSVVHAALPTEVDTASALVVADGVSMANKGYAIVAAVTGAFILLKLFKRVLTRST
jgi:hypothetical protein